MFGIEIHASTHRWPSKGFTSYRRSWKQTPEHGVPNLCLKARAQKTHASFVSYAHDDDPKACHTHGPHTLSPRAFSPSSHHSFSASERRHYWAFVMSSLSLSMHSVTISTFICFPIINLSPRPQSGCIAAMPVLTFKKDTHLADNNPLSPVCCFTYGANGIDFSIFCCVPEQSYLFP